MTAKSKPSYRVYEERGSGRWRWEIATAEGQVIERGGPGAYRVGVAAEGQVIERGRARSAIEARAEAVRRGLGKPKALTVARNINRREIRALPHPRSHFRRRACH